MGGMDLRWTGNVGSVIPGGRGGFFWQANLCETFQGAPRTEGGPEVGGMLITENGEHV